MKILKFMKSIVAVLILVVTSVHASPKDWVSIEVKVKSHHGTNEKMRLKIMKDGRAVKLMVDDFILPETRILTNRQDLDTIVNFSQSEKDSACGKDSFTYVKQVKGKSTEISGCPVSVSFQHLRKAFQNIAAIK